MVVAKKKLTKALVREKLRRKKANASPKPQAEPVLSKYKPLPPPQGMPNVTAKEVALLNEDLCKNNAAYFASQKMATEEKDFMLGRHHIEWAELVNQHERLNILCPRDHGKSYFFSGVVPVWWTYYGLGDVYLFSKSQDQALRLVNQCRDMMLKSPHLAHRLGATQSKGVCETSGGTIYGKGFGNAVRGAHPTLIVNDDVLNDNQLYSETEREKAKDYYYSAITNMIVPSTPETPSKIITIGTPFHKDDLYVDLENNIQYKFKKYEAIYTDENGVECALWPERYSLDLLKGRIDEIGTLRFSREFLCNPISDDASLFPYPLVSQGFDEIAILPHKYQPVAGFKVYMGCDFAMSSSTGADYTCFITLMKDQMGSVYILDIFHEKGLSFTAQKDKIKDLAARYKPSAINIESNVFQRLYHQTLAETTDLPVREYYTTGKKHDLEDGIPKMRIQFENKKIKIPRGNDDSIERTNILVDQLASFGYTSKGLQGMGEHDDAVMAFWMAMEASSSAGFSFEFMG